LNALLSPTQKMDAAASSRRVQGADFGKILDGALGKVSAEMNRADQLQRSYQLGDKSVSLEETMLASQTASVSFQSLVQVRNRMVQAYHDIMNMQV
jgi:flagellar hook-basal body complex protein FliE